MINHRFFFQAEDGIRDLTVTGVQTCALPISPCRAPQLHVERPVDDEDDRGGFAARPTRRVLQDPEVAPSQPVPEEAARDPERLLPGLAERALPRGPGGRGEWGERRTRLGRPRRQPDARRAVAEPCTGRSEEHTSELQSQSNLVCRLLLEKKKKANMASPHGHTKQEKS